MSNPFFGGKQSAPSQIATPRANVGSSIQRRVQESMSNQEPTPEMKPLVAPEAGGQRSRESMIANPKDFAEIHAAIYQTEFDNESKVQAQRDRLSSFKGDIPRDAQEAIESAVFVFGGDKDMTPEALRWALTNVGAIESGYRTRVQGGGGPARGYAQVEPETAIDLAKNSSALFGKKFASMFGKDTLSKLANASEAEASKMLENNESLAMTMAAAKLMAHNEVRRSIVSLKDRES